MHETFKRRLAQLEAERAQQRQPSFVIAFIFAGRYNECDANFADGPDGFVSRRRDSESFSDFTARASAEAFAARPYGMPSVLFFTGPDPAEPPPHAA